MLEAVGLWVLGSIVLGLILGALLHAQDNPPKEKHR